LAGLREHFANVSKFTAERVEKDLLGILARHSREAAELVTDQLEQGQDSRGDNLPDYSPASVQVFGKPAGPWRLYDTGDFYRSILLRTNKFPAVFDATDSKTDEIFAKLESKGANSDQLLGLGDEGKEQLRAEVRADTAAYFRRILGL
jgi:hypothetical protein